MTFVALANITLGSSASSVTFSSIPATYRDLVLVHTGTSSNASSATLLLRFNGDSGTNYTHVGMEGNGSAASSYAFSYSGLYSGSTQSTPISNNIIQIMDYSATDKHKTILKRRNTSSVHVIAQAGRWANTGAITSIVCSIDVGATFSTGTTFALYGIAS